MQNGKYYRSNNKPSIVEYYPNGVVKKEQYITDNVFIRLNNLPTIVKYLSENNDNDITYYYTDALGNILR